VGILTLAWFMVVLWAGLAVNSGRYGAAVIPVSVSLYLLTIIRIAWDDWMG
jgi:hypothetical protein